MKKGPLLTSILILCYSLTSCSKSGSAPSPASSTTSISLNANDSTIGYPVNLVFIQDVGSTHTTLISGQYPDTSGKKGSLALRLLGDTTGRFQGNKLLVTYTDGNGYVYYNNGDTTNYLEVVQYPKTYNGIVTGSFALTVSGSAGMLHFTNGRIKALFQP